MEKLNDPLKVMHLVVACLALAVTTLIGGCGHYLNLLEKIERKADAAQVREDCYPREAGEAVEKGLDRIEKGLDKIGLRLTDIEARLRK